MQPGVTKGYSPEVLTKAQQVIRDHLSFEETDRVALREEIEQRFSVDGQTADAIYSLLWGEGSDKPT